MGRVQASAPSRRRRPWRTAVTVAALLGAGAYVAVQQLTGGPGEPRCTVAAADGGAAYELSPERAANAATISAVASARGLRPRAVTIALATAMQESGLRNLGHGDKDSLGLFQQRPSQDWGTSRQIMDPVYAAGEFYAHLVQVPGYERLPLTEAAQRVQRSGYPLAYAKHETDAALLADALTGRRGAALSCVVPRPAKGADTGGGGGTDAAGTARVRERLVREFGAGVLSGPGAQDAKGAGGGRTLTVPVARSGDDGGVRRGWQVALWSVAHSAELGVEQISYAGRTWRAADAEQGWRRGADPGGPGPASAVRITTGQ
ncbi:heavy metal transporter [Streptomyces benahoarensis]|uniref:Heavy metal transporter n=1 Tax=Streptomyces benahoarensis TaxID=2595054 RepID=A0A553ZNI1_9ACTN|nr:heavy metal transporter [Streptomyces benahoarensis]TSB25766.1 heavy metal transporter [Streptomyces benahoarensis]TSB43024.1 heavy metal transporter [Streptomyces benahoarensis]